MKRLPEICDGSVRLSLLALVVLVISFSGALHGAEKEQERPGKVILPPEAPILELRWARSTDTFHINMDVMKRLQANRVWYSPWGPRWATAADYRNEYDFIHENGMPLTVGPGGAEKKTLLEEHPDWARREGRFMMTKPARATGKTIEIRLSDSYGHRDNGEPSMRVDWDEEPAERWRVLNTTNDALVPRDEWSVEYDGLDAVVTIEGAQSGDRYSVIFLGTGTGRGEGLAITAPEVYESEDYWQSRIDGGGGVAYGADLVRSVNIAFGGWNLGTTEGTLRDWYSYARTITPRTLKGFKEETGLDVDPMWWIDNGQMRSVDDPPPEGLLKWMEYIQGRVMSFAKAYTNWVHEHGCQAVMFWGDGHIGMEPYLGMTQEAGYDEITMPSNNALDCRRVTDFPGPDVDRCVRIWTRGDPPGASLLGRWSNILRGALFGMPRGVSVGGSNADVMAKRPEYKTALRKVYREWDRAYRAADRTDPYTHDLDLYVINAWGKIRSWPRAAWAANPSQKALLALTDLPVNVRFLSLRKIASEGVPDDADVLLNVGEPGSSWSGDQYWTDEAAENVRSFVRDGGGLIGISAPALRGDEFVLSEVFGLKYEGRVSEAARAEHYRSSARAFHEYKAPPMVSLAVNEKSSGLFAELNNLGEVDVHVAMEPDGKSVQQIGGGDGKPADALITLNTFGQGEAAYISGRSGTPAYEEFLQRLIYRVAGDVQAARELHSPTPGAHVYYYPEADRLFIYNRAGDSDKVKVRLGALAEIYGRSVRLRRTYRGRDVEPEIMPTLRTLKAGDLRDEVELQVPRGQLNIFRLRSMASGELNSEGPIEFFEGRGNAVVNKYEGTEDTLIAGKDQADKNLGEGKFLVVGTKHGTPQRALLRFDLEALKGLVDGVKKAEIVWETGWAKRNPTLQVYEITEADADWSESQSTWNLKRAGEPWRGGPGGGEPGAGTYKSKPIATVQNMENPVTVEIPGEVVEKWIEGANSGLLVRCKDDGRVTIRSNNAHELKVYVEPQ